MRVHTTAMSLPVLIVVLMVSGCVNRAGPVAPATGTGHSATATPTRKPSRPWIPSPERREPTDRVIPGAPTTPTPAGARTRHV